MFNFDAAFRAEFRTSWAVLLIAFCTFLFGFSAPAYVLPFVFPEVIEHFGWTREQAMLLASSKYAVGAICALVVGRFVDRTGVWLALVVNVSLGGIALLSFLWIQSLTAYYALGILLGFASGGTMVALKVLISRAFHHSQATAMGVALMGSVAGSVVLPFAIGGAIDAFGWRAGIAWMSAGIWLAAVPMLVFGLLSPRMAFGRREDATQAERATGAAERSETLRRVMREPRFWLIGTAVFLVALVDQAFTQHQVLIYSDAGISRTWMEIGVSTIGVAGIVTRLIVGNILDATSNRGLAVLWWLLSLSVLMAFALASPVIFIAYILFRAMGHSAVLLDTITMTKHVWGKSAQLGTLLGIYTAFVSAGFAVGPWLMGWLHDVSGSYGPAYILFAIIPVVASLLIWRVEPVFWKQLRASRSEAGPAA
ncbi:MFS transporter [Sphingomonas canadensis]|uniref:MFS transporter n=1 Tax=Sphingomonas canadensis TaxID=1219257 RepID=A0ABW3H8Q4_9SPHN|nr:MFS transporter [Sphingomonas canadensis]MCW3837593.1 MFS transporter [Sphingomonas canadensis]